MNKTNIIYASKDTFVSRASDSLNFGTDLSLFISNNLTEKSAHHSFIYFDLSSLPANVIITGASLELSLFRNDNKDSISLSILKLLKSFDEYATTANLKPKSEPLDEKDASHLEVNGMVDITKPLPPLVFINLTNTVSNWYNDPDSNFGFSIRPAPAPAPAPSPILPIGFWSREYSNTNLRPKLTIEYTLNTSISNIETNVSLQKIFPTEKGNETTIYDISKDLFFNYFIYNPKNTPVSITVLSSNNKTGPFTPIGKRYNCPASDAPNKNNVLVEVLPINKYVCLSVQSISFPTRDKLQVSATHKTFANMISSSFSSALLSEGKLAIVLTMTKPLTIIYDKKILEELSKTFTVIIGDKPEPVPVTIVFTTSTQLILTPEGGSDLNPDNPLTITYKATDEFYLTGINGNVDNITNMELTNLSTDCLFVSGNAIDPRFILLTMSQPLKSEGNPEAFTLTVFNKPTLTPFRIHKDSNPLTIVLEFNKSISESDILSISYSATGDGDIVDVLGNRIPNFANKPVTTNFKP